MIVLGIILIIGSLVAGIVTTTMGIGALVIAVMAPNQEDQKTHLTFSKVDQKIKRHIVEIQNKLNKANLK